MELYIGGRCQGKLEYVLARRGGACGETYGGAGRHRGENGGNGQRAGGRETGGLRLGEAGGLVVADGENCHLDGPLDADILNHFHLLIKRLAACDRDVFAYIEDFLARNPQAAVICDEVGMGIVPADPFERRYRETVGRCCCMLAKRAGRVERIVCGRSMRIK